MTSLHKVESRLTWDNNAWRTMAEELVEEPWLNLLKAIKLVIAYLQIRWKCKVIFSRKCLIESVISTCLHSFLVTQLRSKINLKYQRSQQLQNIPVIPNYRTRKKKFLGKKFGNFEVPSAQNCLAQRLILQVMFMCGGFHGSILFVKFNDKGGWNYYLTENTTHYVPFSH